MNKQKKDRKDFSAFLDIACDGIFELNSKGNLTYLNQTGLKKLGYSNLNDLLKNDFDKNPPFFLKSIEKNLPSDPDTIKNMEVKCQAAQGEELHLEISIEKINKKDGFRGIFKDITGTKNLESNLEKVEKKLKNLLENLPDIIFSLDPGGKILSINDTVTELLNLNPSAIIDKHYSLLISGKYSNEIESNLNRLRTGEIKVIRNFELPLFSSGKIKKEFDLSAKGIYNPDGELTEVIGVMRDITAREEIKKEIENTKNFLKLIQENIEEGIMVINKDFEIILLNKFTLQLCGLECNTEEVKGKKCFEILHNKLKPCPGCASQSTFSTGEVYKIPMKLNKNNEFMDLEVTTYPIKDIYGEVIQVIETVKNVTEKKYLENRISEYTLRLEEKIAELHMLNAISNILQTTYSLDAVLQIILIGVTASQGLMFNRAFLLLVNEEEEILEGKLAIGPSNDEEAYQIWGELSQHYHSLEEILMTYENILMNKNIKVNEIISKIKIPLSDKDHILIRSIQNKKSYNVIDNKVESIEDYEVSSFLGTGSFVVSPLVAKEKVLGVIIADNYINNDPISKEDLELLEIFSNHASFAIENTVLVKELGTKVNELEEFNKMLSDYQKKMSKTERLATIGEFANYLAHEIRNPLASIGGFARTMLKGKSKNDKDRNYLNIMYKEVKRLERLLSNIMDFTKNFEPQLQYESLDSVLEDTLLMFYGEINDEVVIVKRFEEDLPLINIDSHQIKQVALNILRNAHNAMPDGGIITIGTRSLENNVIQFSISDTGAGMPENLLEDAFKPFFTTNPSGTGLGLAISNQIIQNHKGNIKIESKENEGTTVYIQFPFANG